MRLNNRSTTLGLAAAFTLGIAALASAQTTPQDSATAAGARGTAGSATTTAMPKSTKSKSSSTSGTTSGSMGNMGGMSNMSSGTSSSSSTADSTKKRRTTSSTRIKVSKNESAGEVETPAPAPTPAPEPTPAPAPAPMPEPTPAPAPAPAPAPVVVDTTPAMASTVMPMMKKYGVGWYLGLGGGASMPSNATLRSAYSTGWNVTVPFGYDSPSSPFGLRFDVSYDRMGGRAFTSTVGGVTTAGTNEDLGIWSGSADAKLRFPLPSARSAFYLVGGGSAHRYKNAGLILASGQNTGNNLNNSVNDFGWNAGGGFSFGWGRSELFVESRYFSMQKENPFGEKARFMPVVIGFTF